MYPNSLKGVAFYVLVDFCLFSYNLFMKKLLQNVMLCSVLGAAVVAPKAAHADQEYAAKLLAQLDGKKINEMRFSISWPFTSFALCGVPIDPSLLNFIFRFDHHIDRFCYAFSASFNGLLLGLVKMHDSDPKEQWGIWCFQDFLIGGIPYKSSTVKFAMNFGMGFVQLKRPLNDWELGGRMFLEFAWFRTKGNLYALEIGGWKGNKGKSGPIVRFSVAWNML